MSYYGTGYMQWARWIDENNPRTGVGEGVKLTNDKGLCIVKIAVGDWMPGYYDYYLCHPKSNFSIIDPQESLAYNFNDWISNNANSYEISYGNIETDTETPPSTSDIESYSNMRTASPPSWLTLTNDHEKLLYTNLPIFSITAEEYEGLNKYIESGDDSDADNYDDLHPSKVHLDVWLDGNCPTMFCKAVMDSGESSGEVSISIYSNPNTVPSLTLHDSFEIDVMRSYSYDQYQNANPIIDTRYELIGLYGGGGGVSSYFVLKSNGEVDSTTNGLGNKIDIEYHIGSPSDNDYPEDNTNFDTNPTYNNYSGTNTLTKTYELDSTKLKTFGNFMWSSTFKDNVLSLLQSPMENIVSLKAMPLSGMGGNSENIKVGNVDSNISAPVVVDADSKKTTVGTVKIPRIFNNFIDYTQFSIMIYLPFIGFKELDPIAVMGKSLKLYYIWDCVLGNVMAELYLQGDNGAMLLYKCFQGSCGIDIAISSTNRGQIETGYVANGISALTNLFTGNLVGAGKDVFSGLTQEFHSESNGVGNPSLLGKMDMTARVIIKRPQSFTPKGYGHTVGYPCHQYNKLKTFGDNTADSNKFVRCKNFICSITDDDQKHDIVIDALDGEKQEIKELLESGIYV